MSSALARLADEVGVHERTLRRAIGVGLIRSRRPSARRLSLSASEIEWVRSHWSVVSALLAALRTEPNVVMAVLFGSVARGEGVDEMSDVDLLVDLRRFAPGAIEALRSRLAVHIQPQLQLVPLQAAKREPRLLAEILRDGRLLVDREDEWATLHAQRDLIEARAEREGRTLHSEARAAIGYFERLAAGRAVAPPLRASQ